MINTFNDLLEMTCPMCDEQLRYHEPELYLDSLKYDKMTIRFECPKKKKIPTWNPKTEQFEIDGVKAKLVQEPNRVHISER